MSNTRPVVGDTVYAVTVIGVQHAEKRLCKVNRIVAGAEGDYINAAFPEYRDAEGMLRHARDWNVVGWITKGDTVKATDIPGYSHLEGQVVTVTAVHSEPETGRPYFEADGFKDSRYPNTTTLNLAFYGAEKCDPLPAKDETVLKSVHDAEIERLNTELTRLQERLRQAQEHYRADMQRIESIMHDVKEEQSWCDEGTNEVISKINSGLVGGWSFDLYEEEFELEVTVTGTITKTVSVTVSAVNLDAARDALADDPDSYLHDDADTILTEAARYASFEDIEVEVA